MNSVFQTRAGTRHQQTLKDDIFKVMPGCVMQGIRGRGDFDEEEDEEDEGDDPREVNRRQTRYAFSTARFRRDRVRENASTGGGKAHGRRTRASKVGGPSYGHVVWRALLPVCICMS